MLNIPSKYASAVASEFVEGTYRKSLLQRKRGASPNMVWMRKRPGPPVGAGDRRRMTHMLESFSLIHTFPLSSTKIPIGLMSFVEVAGNFRLLFLTSALTPLLA